MTTKAAKKTTTKAAKKTTTKAAKKTTPKRAERAVIITTAHKGVFFGYATETDGETVALKRARNCLYWDALVRGFMGLAAHGPTAGCRVGPAADISLRGVTSVLEVTQAAAEAWEKAPWSR